MSTLLRIVGAIWAIIGAWNVVAMPWSEPGRESLLGFGLIFNMLLFILPGLVVYGIGAGIARRRASQAAVPASQRPGAPQQSSVTTEQRLAKLQDLRRKGLINDSEYDTRRKQIIDEL